MKTDSPIETLRSLRPRPETRAGAPAEGLPHDEGFAPRYVEVPRHRRAVLAAERNLKWGLALLLLAIGLLGAGSIIAGPRALLPLLICLLTFTVLWVMARVRIFHQRNGIFFAAATVCLLGALVPMIETCYVALDRMVHGTRVADAPSVNAEPAAAVGSEKSGDAPIETVQSLVEAFKVPPVTNPAAMKARMLEDTRVLVGRKTYLLRNGEVFELDDIKDGQATLLANELRLNVPEAAIDVVTPKRDEPPVLTGKAAATPAAAPPPPAPVQSTVSDQELPADVAARAQAEVVRRYPAIGVKGSPENQLFVQRVGELRAERPDFFAEPEWPLYMAEALATEQGWKRTP